MEIKIDIKPEDALLVAIFIKREIESGLTDDLKYSHHTKINFTRIAQNIIDQVADFQSEDTKIKMN